jgi:uncharacterized protein
MSEDKIRYDILASEAMRGIIRTVLNRVQKRGLPGEHHFYIEFDTTAPGAVLSKRLKAQYPEFMTIVLQHKFWDLLVYDDRFEVKLSFNQVPERLVIPFAAIKTFADPSVPFGFNPNYFASPATPAYTAAENIIDGDDAPEQRGPLPAPSLKLETVPVDQPEADDAPIVQEEQPDQGSAKVVELDLFRRK